MTTDAIRMLVLIYAMGLVSAEAPAAELSAPVDVAPDAEGTRKQVWADAAWNAGAGCWLVVWREGYLNEPASDIWCARVSADGKALDPAGIRLTEGAGLKDKPEVASDGKGFLVVWEDLRNGRDASAGSTDSAGSRTPSGSPQAGSAQGWDVYAARVSGEGTPLDPNGVLLAGGAHNQCRPAVAFAKGNYHVVWMGFEDAAYRVFGACVAAGAVKPGGTPTRLIAFEPEKNYEGRDNPRQLLMPAIAANAAGDVLMVVFAADMRQQRWTVRQALDGATGKPLGPPTGPPRGRRDDRMPGMVGSYRDGNLGLALGADGAVLVTTSNTVMKSTNDVTVTRMSKTGEVAELKELGSPMTVTDKFRPIVACHAAAFDGKSYLVFDNCLRSTGKRLRSADIPEKCTACVAGWRVAPDGTVEDEKGFLVAGEGDREGMLPAASAGPEGAVLVVYSEARGVDDVKVAGRIVK